MNRCKAPEKQRLSGLDTSFLYLERKEIPLHMAGVFLFEGPLPFDDFVRRVESQLDLIPRFRQIVVSPPYNLGYPAWEQDPKFDIHRHVLRVRLDAPGEEADLEALSGRILGELMDRRRPLWDMHVVDGLRDGRGALIFRLHHSAADGIAGAALILQTIFDSSVKGSYAVKGKRVRAAPHSSPHAPLIADIASGIWTSTAHLAGALSGAWSIAKGLWRDPGAIAAAVKLLPDALSAFERLPVNAPCSGDRLFCWAECNLAQAQAIRAAAGGSINDVILTVLTRALSRYVQLHGQTVARRSVRVVCPVNLRTDNGESTGNRLAFMPVAVPLDITDPVRLLKAVAVRTAAMKRLRAAHMITVLANCFGAAPPPVQNMLWQWIGNVLLPVPLLNIICTNIPGSGEQLYCVGRKLLAWYPQVPTGYELGINCAVTRYRGELSFGLIADAHVAPDVRRLRDLMRESFEELRAAAVAAKAGARHDAGPTTRPSKSARAGSH